MPDRGRCIKLGTRTRAAVLQGSEKTACFPNNLARAHSAMPLVVLPSEITEGNLHANKVLRGCVVDKREKTTLDGKSVIEVHVAAKDTPTELYLLIIVPAPLARFAVCPCPPKIFWLWVLNGRPGDESASLLNLRC